MFKYLVFLMLSIMSVTAQATEQCELPKQVSLSFDDDLAIDGFYDSLYLFEKYGVKATLYVSKWPNLTNLQKQKLLAIQAAGHEVGNHGLWHRNATDFAPTEHKATDVDPAIPYARGIGLGIHTFAYPYGARTPLHDAELLKSYVAVRGFTTNYSVALPSGKPSITAYSIDSGHYNFNKVATAIDNLQPGETVYFAGHVIGPWANEWHITTSDLEAVLNYGQSNNVKFCTVKDC